MKRVILVIFGLGIQNKTVKQLRKQQGLRAKDLAFLLKIDTVDILKIDCTKLQNIPDPLKTKMIPILRGDNIDKIPWL